MRFCVFVGGISGSGKTTLATSLAAKGLGVQVSASQIIKRERGLEAERPRVVNADEAAINQELLVTGFAKFRLDVRAPILLDGHFVLASEEGYVDVATEVIRELDPDVIVLVRAPTSDVASRLRARPVPAKWWDGTDAAIDTYAERESERAADAAAQLNVPLLFVDHGDGTAVAEVLEEAIRMLEV